MRRTALLNFKKRTLQQNVVMSYPLLRYAKTLRLLYVFVMKDQFKTILISIVFLLSNIVCFAQDVDPPPPPAPPNPPGTPIDQNILLLLMVGLIYGAYSIYFSSKKNN